MKPGQSLNHVEMIQRLLLTMGASDKVHALIITGPAGFGKSTAVEEALWQSRSEPAHLGSYCSPLHLFNFLHDHSERKSVVVIDDTSGVFGEASSMAILKAATWNQGKPRILRWGSTTGKAIVDEFEFLGKIVIVCNSFPSTSDASAVKSRAFSYQFEVSLSQAKDLLQNAARDPRWFKNPIQAQQVADFLCDLISDRTYLQVSYRTLQLGYELAEHNPQDWQSLLSVMISTDLEDPKGLIRKLSKEPISVTEQFGRFEAATGLKRRTFFKYRRELNISQR